VASVDFLNSGLGLGALPRDLSDEVRSPEDIYDVAVKHTEIERHNGVSNGVGRNPYRPVLLHDVKQRGLDLFSDICVWGIVHEPIDPKVERDKEWREDELIEQHLADNDTGRRLVFHLGKHHLVQERVEIMNDRASDDQPHGKFVEQGRRLDFLLAEPLGDQIADNG